MRPLADLLIALSSKINTCLNILHIPYCDLRYTMILAEVDHLAAGFMQNIPLLTPIFGRGFSFVFEQLPLPLRSILAAVYARLIGCQPLISQTVN
jgi:hypothetical protein